MTVKTEGRHAGEFLLSEANGGLSRDTITVAVPAATTYEAGTVLGQVASSGHYGPYDDAKSDGLETAKAILFDNLTNEAAAPAQLSAVVVNQDAEVRADDLTWGTGVDEAGGLLDLRSVGIKARS